MALTDDTRRRLAVVLGSEAAANDVVTIVNAGTGTLAEDTQRRIWNVMGTSEGVAFIAEIHADTSLEFIVRGKLVQLLGATAATDFTAEQGTGTATIT